MHRLFLVCIKRLRKYIRIVADQCDIALEYHAEAIGRHPLVIEDFAVSKQHFIPKSVIFNTMCGSIFVGRNTGFGHRAMIITGKHMGVEEAAETEHDLHFVPESGRDIRIGRNCFIGTAAVILGNVTIGDYAIVGAGSVVTKDVPAGAFVAGVPAKVIHLQKFPETTAPVR